MMLRSGVMRGLEESAAAELVSLLRAEGISVEANEWTPLNKDEWFP